MAGQVFDAENQAALAEQDGGLLEVYTASDAFYAELKDVAAPLTARWVKRINGMGVDGDAMLARYQELVAELTGE